MINPGFFVDEDVAKLTPLARLLFIGMWTLADKQGRLEDRPARIKLQLLGYDDCDAERLLSEIAALGFVTRYQVGTKKLLQIRSFTKHQRPHPKEPDTALPGPPELAVEKHGEPELAGRICPESESESVPSGSSESVTESESVNGRSEELVKFGQAVVEEWHKLRGSDFPQPSQRDFHTLTQWQAGGIPLRVVLRGMADLAEVARRSNRNIRDKPLAYFDSAVQEAARMWRKAVQVPA